MYIKNIITQNHCVFGSTTIDLFGKIQVQSQIKNEVNIPSLQVNCAIDTEKKNRYTFIIGENGSGKSVFVQTLTALNSCRQPMADATDSHRNECSRLFLNDSDYGNLFFPKSTWQYLTNFGVMGSPVGTPYLNNVVHLAPFFDPRIIQDNSSYCEFEIVPFTSEFVTQFVKSYIHCSSPQQKKFLQLLEKYCCSKIDISYSCDFFRELGTQTEYILLNNFNLTLFSFVDAIQNLSQKSFEITDNYIECSIVKSRTFIKQYRKSNKTIQELCNQILNNKWFQQIKNFCDKTAVKIDKNEYLIKKGVDTRSAIDDIAKNVFRISSDDFWIVQLMDELGIIRISAKNGNIPITSMSSGERAILRMFTALASTPNNAQENILFIYDEPETSLNPKWQQKIIRIFKTLVDEVFEIKSSHFIIVTHSPFIIMEVPKGKDQQQNSVLAFSRINGEFTCKQIANIESYCIEQLLLDDFGIDYRTETLVNEVQQILSKRNESKDPIEKIKLISEYKKEIDELYHQTFEKK